MRFRAFVGGLLLALCFGVHAATLVTLPQQLVVDSSGDPRSGAKLYVYEAGTTTPLTTYTTPTLDVAHANPVVADANGLFDAIYIDPSDGDYKLVLKDSSDVTIWTEDDIPNGVSFSATIGSAKLQAFTLRIENASGTLKHRFCDESVNCDSSQFVDKISGATNTLTATPTGTDSSTAFANGGKIGSVSTNEFILNHAIAASASFGPKVCSIALNDSDTDLFVSVVRRSVNVNGTTLSRWHLQFRQSSDGGAFALNATNIAAGEIVAVQCILYIP